MDAYALHLAMAALVGASFVAVSAYYMHRKTLSQFLELTKTFEREREGEEAEEEDGKQLSPRHYRRLPDRRRQKSIGAYRRASLSLPDVTAISGEADAVDKRNSVLPVEGIPAGLPRLRSLSEGICFGFV